MRPMSWTPRDLARLALASLVLAVSAPAARADVPAGYKGKPFDPATAGGKGVIPATVKAGPYAVPGRIDLINYDLGGVGVAYDCAHHEVKGGFGYRTDTPTATLSLTAPSKPDLWYQAGAALDGTPYPSATTEDFYVGAIDAGDWFNYTIDVKTAGTYAVSSTWSTGNGPPGAGAGDGSMGVQISINGALAASWQATFPDLTKANYHNWKPYPSFATLTLEAGLQVLKIQSTKDHFNFDYLELALADADAGVAGAPDGAAGAGGGGTAGAAATGGASSASGVAGAAGVAGASGAGGARGAAGTSGAAGSSSQAGASGAPPGAAGASASTGSGAAPATGTGGAGPPGAAPSGGGCGCALASPDPRSALGVLLGCVACAALARARRRTRS
jgi:hypothetical protein